VIDLKALRGDKNISQKKLSEILNIQQSRISKIERGNEGISKSLRIKILNTYPDADNFQIKEEKKIDEKEILVQLLEKYMKTSTKMEIKIETLLSELNEYRKKYGPLPNN